MRAIVLLGVLAVCAGCRKPADDDPRPTPAPSAVAVVASTTSASAPTLASAPASSAPSADAGVPAPLFASGTSKTPTFKEWRAGKPVPVRFADSLWCETLAVREWLRISCRSAEGAPNLIQSVGRSGGTGGEVYVFNGERVASAVIAVRPKADVQLTFEWSSWGTRTFVLTLPPGADAPKMGFDRGAPRSKSGLPRCIDVCAVRFHHHVSGACFQPPACGQGFRCETWREGGEDTGMCVCDVDCDPYEAAPEGTTL